jgi:ribosomal protein L1
MNHVYSCESVLANSIANNNIEVPKNVVIATNDVINALEQCGSNLSKTNGTRNKKKLGSSSRVYTYCVN